MIFGIYEKLVDCVLNFFKDIKNNIKFLLPILIGIFIGAVIFGNLLRFLFNNFDVQTKFCFIGLILGSIPNLFKTANSKNGFRLHYLIYTIIAFGVAIFLLLLENAFSFNSINENTTFLFLVFAGFIMAIGVVVPGISSTVILMMLGVYNLYLFSVSTLDFNILLPMGIGLALGSIVFLIIIKYCLDKFHVQTYYAIIGFVLGSIPILYPGLQFNITGLTSVLLFFLGLYVCNKIGD